MLVLLFAPGGCPGLAALAPESFLNQPDTHVPWREEKRGTAIAVSIRHLFGCD
jgi:hypothetical protein